MLLRRLERRRALAPRPRLSLRLPPASPMPPTARAWRRRAPWGAEARRTAATTAATTTATITTITITAINSSNSSSSSSHRRHRRRPPRLRPPRPPRRSALTITMRTTSTAAAPTVRSGAPPPPPPTVRSALGCAALACAALAPAICCGRRHAQEGPRRRPLHRMRRRRRCHCLRSAHVTRTVDVAAGAVATAAMAV